MGLCMRARLACAVRAGCVLVWGADGAGRCRACGGQTSFGTAAGPGALSHSGKGSTSEAAHGGSVTRVSSTVGVRGSAIRWRAADLSASLTRKGSFFARSCRTPWGGTPRYVQARNVVLRGPLAAACAMPRF